MKQTVIAAARCLVVFTCFCLPGAIGWTRPVTQPEAVATHRGVLANTRTHTDTPRIAVMSAFEPEWAVLLGALRGAKTHQIGAQRFVTGRLQGQDVVLFLSGISMVNAAMTTQKALDHFNIRAVVFSGIAGGVNPALSMGDVVVAEAWGQYLESIFARETPTGFKVPPFLKAEYPNFGMIHPRAIDVLRLAPQGPSDALAQGAPDVEALGALATKLQPRIEKRYWFPADPALLQTARSLIGKVQLERCTASQQCLSHTPQIVVGGHGVSGPAFVDNAAFRDFAFSVLQAQVLDMESAAAAQVAFSSGVPFIAFRSLSDLAGGGSAENEMGAFFALASTNSAKVVLSFLAALPAKKSAAIKTAATNGR